MKIYLRDIKRMFAKFSKYIKLNDIYTIDKCGHTYFYIPISYIKPMANECLDEKCIKAVMKYNSEMCDAISELISNCIELDDDPIWCDDNDGECLCIDVIVSDGWFVVECVYG